MRIINESVINLKRGEKIPADCSINEKMHVLRGVYEKFMENNLLKIDSLISDIGVDNSKFITTAEVYAFNPSKFTELLNKLEILAKVTEGSLSDQLYEILTELKK